MIHDQRRRNERVTMIPDRIPPSKDECPTSSRTAQSREIDDVMGKGPTGKSIGGDEGDASGSGPRGTAIFLSPMKKRACGSFLPDIIEGRGNLDHTLLELPGRTRSSTDHSLSCPPKSRAALRQFRHFFKEGSRSPPANSFLRSEVKGPYNEPSPSHRRKDRRNAHRPQQSRHTPCLRVAER